MSELIDRQALIKQLKDENIPFNADINEIINIQPIAFDVDNIMAKLEEKHIDISGNTSLHYLYSEGYIDALDYVSDIVKQEINNGLE